MTRRVYLGGALVVGVCLALWWWRTEPTARPPALAVDGAKSSTNARVEATPSISPSVLETAGQAFATSTPWQDTPLAEADYLRQLRALNQVDKAAALLLVEKGEQWYGDQGPAAEARRAMRVTLLVDLGRMREARGFAREFISSYPESRYRTLVQGVTGIHPRPSPGAGR